jgi:hypothetical protein
MDPTWPHEIAFGLGQYRIRVLNQPPGDRSMQPQRLDLVTSQLGWRIASTSARRNRRWESTLRYGVDSCRDGEHDKPGNGTAER